LRVIVLGSKGQLGSDVASVLEAAGLNVSRVTRHELDASSPHSADQMGALPKADFLVNCMAFVNVDAAENASGEAFQVNATFPTHLATHCRVTGAKLIHISTDFVFKGDLGRAYLESDESAPVNIYGLSKAAGELGVRGALREHFILRVSGLYGVAGSGSKGGNFVETMINLGRERGVLQVVDDQFTSPTHSLDVARAILAIILDSNAAYGTFHCANEGLCSWFEFAREIIRQARIPADVKPVKFANFKMKAPRPLFSALSSAKLKTVYAMPKWQDALAEYMTLRHSR